MGVKTGLRRYKLEGSEHMVIVDPKTAKVRPYLAACVIKNVTIGDDLIKSIMQMGDKLDLTHSRKRKKAATYMPKFLGKKSRAHHWPAISSITTIPGSLPLSFSTAVDAHMPITMTMLHRTSQYKLFNGINQKIKKASTLPAVPGAIGV